MLVVMVTIGASLVLAAAFVRTQMSILQVSRNTARRDMALQAAQTGAAVALHAIQSPDWSGVAERWQSVLAGDSEGAAAYEVELLRWTGPAADETSEPPADASLHVLLRSTGRWQPAVPDSGGTVERRVDVLVRLEPRLPGRPPRPGDLVAATDLAANPAHYDSLQQQALSAGTPGSIVPLDPGLRIEGSARLRGQLRLFQGPSWNAEVRSDLLDAIGAEWVTSEGDFLHPHPLSGRARFQTNPPGPTRSDLDRLNVPWERDDFESISPTIDFSGWRTYRLYDGGFEYSAETVGGVLEDVVLRPTAENPLGVFFREGNLRLRNHVTVQGTLVATGRITLEGRDIHLASYNWREDEGRPVHATSEAWPRLPALVADQVRGEEDARALVEGAVVSRQGVAGAAGTLERANAPELNLQGTATARPVRQPFSVVRIAGSADLGQVRGNGDHSVWLADGTSGAWYPIVGVHAGRGELTVAGEVRFDEPTPFRIRRSLVRSLRIRGPVTTGTFEVAARPEWALTASQWDLLHTRWKSENALRQLAGLPRVPFVDWLANPLNFAEWQPPHALSGLSLEPTWHVRHSGEAPFRWSPPLFVAWRGSGEEAKFSGYRWKVVYWRETR